jgi:hypothetical protein
VAVVPFLENILAALIDEDTFLETLYNSLTGQKSGKFVKHN